MHLKDYMLIFMILPPIMLTNQVKKEVSQISTGIVDNIEIQGEVIEEFKEEIIEDIPEKSIEEDIIEMHEEVQEKIQEEVIVTKFNVNGLILKEGISSEEVLRIKSFLKKKGYINITEGYYFDKKTKDAISSYQKENGLKVDGIVGRNTYQKINEDMELNKINIPEIKIEFTKEIPQGNFIIINKNNNTLYHLTEKQVIKKYPVGTGKSPEYTPEGKFTIITKYVNPYWGGAGRNKPIKGGAPNNPLGKRWMGLNIKGGGTYGIHGNSNKQSIGKYVSLGCVRMYNEDVESLYQLIDKGTPVWIGNETKLEEYGVIFKLDN